MSGQQIMRIYALRRWWVITSVLAGIIVGSVLAFTLPSIYESRSQAIVSVSDRTNVTAGESAAYVGDRIPTILEIAKSADFARVVAETPGVDLSASEVRSALQFALVPETTVIGITANADDPNVARQLADAASETISDSFLISQLGPDSGLEISVLQEAGEGTSAVFPDPVRFIAFGGLAGLTVGLILAPLRHGLDRRVRDVRDIRNTVGAQLLGVRDAAPSRSLRRMVANSGVATSTPVLLARLGVVGSRTGTRALALCGIEGVGNELASDLVETAAASGLNCALVSADPAALQTAHYRELSQVRGIDVVDADGGRGGGILSGRDLVAAMPRPYDSYDLIVYLGTDLVARPDASLYLDRADVAIIVTGEAPERSDLLVTRELIRAHGSAVDGFVVVSRNDRVGSGRSRAYGDRPRRAVKSRERTEPDISRGSRSSSIREAADWRDASEPATAEMEVVAVPRSREVPVRGSVDHITQPNSAGGQK
ncbi:hypothetical protein KACC15558_23850 [Brevibacterium ammoniilyticum]|uniref:Polysaccharide chain length determinant N-terminal domain-containing protein n=1 Tax=Brevibacterium ammoniilyticum TaxID=1046555 RepID=A0ABP9U7R0_9MICO